MIGVATLATFVALLLLGVPLFVGIGLASLLGLLLLGVPSWSIVALQFFQGINSFPLVAIPLFLLMANLMTVGGVTSALVRFATSLIGHVRGSLAIGNVAASTLFAGISGSCLADTAAVGSIMIPAMIEEGYPPAFAGAVTAAANIVGPIIPPSILMILYGFAAEQSVAQLFVAGIVPGLILSIVCGGVAFWLSKRHSYGSISETFSLGRAAAALVGALPALVIPALIVAGVVWGVFTLTESAGAAALYALIYAMVRGLILGRMPWRALARAFHRTAIDTGVVMILIGGSSLLSWVLARSQLPQLIVSSMHGFGRDETLLMINLLLLAFGMFLEPAASILLGCSILLPLIKSLNIDLIHFGIVMIVNLQIGVLLPPVGASALVASRMAGIPFERQVRALAPFIALGIVTLIFVTYIPALSLWLPRHFAG
ncbi:MAG TPA: TRAP transporter large permease [Alphaproteobacteria bacterium]|nr:TRAP transporter large permease [Alphaproteobacteria bacterium]